MTNNCHKSVMIKLMTALGASVVVLGVTPIATAEPGENLDARSYVIDVTGNELPAALGKLEYPTAAISKSREGQCELSMRLAPDGATESHHVVGCSHPSFSKAARVFAETLNFDPTLAGTEQNLTVSWNVEK